MPQSYAAIYIHAVFSTKNRIPLITPEILPRLYEYIGGLFRKRNSPLLAAGGIADHIHLLISLHREAAVSPLIRDIKSISSGWIHDTLGVPAFDWQDGFAAFSVSHSGLDDVKHYLARQAEHHHKMTFQEELIALLKKHNIPYDERYIFA